MIRRLRLAFAAASKQTLELVKSFLAYVDKSSAECCVRPVMVNANEDLEHRVQVDVINWAIPSKNRWREMPVLIF